MRNNPNCGIGTALFCQLIDKEFYRKGTLKSHHWVWLTKAAWLGISYQTYMRHLNRDLRTAEIPEAIYLGVKQAVKRLC